MSKNFQNSYIPEYVPSDLKWYKKDRLMTCIDQLKYQEFIKNTSGHFQNTQIVSFDIICK